MAIRRTHQLTRFHCPWVFVEFFFFLGPHGRISSVLGVFVVCFAGTDPRGEEALVEAGLHLHIRQDVVFRFGQPPTITVLAAKKTPTKEPERREPIVIRDADGAWTEDFWKIRKSMEIDQ